MRLPRLDVGRTGDEVVPDWPSATAGAAADAALPGSWSATRWQYAGKSHHGQLVDVVAGLKGSVTMSLSAAAFVITWEVPGHGSGSVGGSVTMADGELTLRPHGGGEVAVVRYRVSALTLALSGEGSAWDFDGNGEEPADFVAVLVRL